MELGEKQHNLLAEDMAFHHAMRRLGMRVSSLPEAAE
jgi:hypothetical protein